MSLNGPEKIQYDWLKLKSYKLWPKDPELLTRYTNLPNSNISNINSKYTYEVEDWEEKMKILDPDNPK